MPLGRAGVGGRTTPTCLKGSIVLLAVRVWAARPTRHAALQPPRRLQHAALRRPARSPPSPSAMPFASVRLGLRRIDFSRRTPHTARTRPSSFGSAQLWQHSCRNASCRSGRSPTRTGSAPARGGPPARWRPRAARPSTSGSREQRGALGRVRLVLREQRVHSGSPSPRTRMAAPQPWQRTSRQPASSISRCGSSGQAAGGRGRGLDVGEVGTIVHVTPLDRCDRPPVVPATRGHCSGRRRSSAACTSCRE
jgi:hypothetical protein